MTPQPLRAVSNPEQEETEIPPLTAADLQASLQSLMSGVIGPALQSMSRRIEELGATKTMSEELMGMALRVRDMEARQGFEPIPTTCGDEDCPGVEECESDECPENPPEV